MDLGSRSWFHAAWRFKSVQWNYLGYADSGGFFQCSRDGFRFAVANGTYSTLIPGADSNPEPQPNSTKDLRRPHRHSVERTSPLAARAGSARIRGACLLRRHYIFGGRDNHPIISREGWYTRYGTVDNDPTAKRNTSAEAYPTTVGCRIVQSGCKHD